MVCKFDLRTLFKINSKELCYSSLMMMKENWKFNKRLTIAEIHGKETSTYC